LPTALLYCKRFEKYDPYWIEEPFSPDDIENHSKLASSIGITVATGEIEAGRWRFKEILEKRAAEILQADAAVCGGISEWRRIAHTAANYGVTMCPHWLHDLHVHRGIRAERALCRILSRRPGLKFSKANQPPIGGPEWRVAVTADARFGF
jgi:L-alanine-DL-glutamate epimerase-like enolase superfamily enzyme